MRIPSLIVALVACIGLSTTSYAANVIVNGDFSTGVFTPWTQFTTANGNVNASITSFDVTGTGASLAGTFVVGQQTFVSGASEGGGISQFVNTGTGTGTFNMNIAADNAFAADNADGGTFSVLLDGVTETSFAVGQIGADSTVRSTLSFSAPVTAGSHEIEILITRAFTPFGNLSDYVDNISFDAPSGVVSAVPLPAALPLFATGLAGLGLLGWRRKRKAGG
jgi:hypothetical protein